MKERPKARFSVDRPRCVVCSRDGDLVQWLLATAVQCTVVTWCGGAVNRGDLVQCTAVQWLLDGQKVFDVFLRP